MNNKYQFMKLGDILVKEGIITQADLDRALIEQKDTREKLGHVLIKQGSIVEDDLVKAFSLQLGQEHILEEDMFLASQEVVQLIPEDFAAENNVLAFTSGDNTKVKFYDVYADSSTIAPGMGVKFNDTVEPSKYYILYPSSGGLRRTDASLYNTNTLFAGATPLNAGNTQPIHNGACRLIWDISNYGHFENQTFPTAIEYLKKINPESDKQSAWSLNGDANYSTIQELRGVFGKTN